MKTLIFALGVMSLVGCKGMTPVGPLAKKVPVTQQGQPLPSAGDATARATPQRPAPPTLSVGPGDVDPANPRIAADKLTADLAADSKATVNAPVTAEVSRVGRVK